MKIIFFGTPEFAAYALKTVVESGHNVIAVVTAPDKPAGRGLKLQQSAVKQYASSVGLTVLQPESLKDLLFIQNLKQLNADLFIVVAFRMLPEVVWSMPPLGCFNLHASLLPQYRGAAPINHAIINGEVVTGVTTFFLQKEIDTGEIILQKPVSIDWNDTAGTLHDKLMQAGAALILETLKCIEAGTVETKNQNILVKDQTNLLAASKIYKDDCEINWKQEVSKVYNFIRGLSPYPTAFGNFINNGENITIKIFRATAEISEGLECSPELITDGKSFLKVACKNGFICIDELQLAGKKRMGVREFLAGFKPVGFMCR